VVGQLLVLERVVAGKQFAWGLTLHARMVAQLDHCRSTDRRRVRFWVHPSGLVFGKGVNVASEGSIGDVGGTRVAIEAMFDSFASSWW
jgi:hypothetical protein